MEKIRVRLKVPDTEIAKMQYPGANGEHFAYHGKTGNVVCGAGKDGAWVKFDGQGPHEYVGCPIRWLEVL